MMFKVPFTLQHNILISHHGEMYQTNTRKPFQFASSKLVLHDMT
jgi:hypothetical protein